MNELFNVLPFKVKLANTALIKGIAIASIGVGGAGIIGIGFLGNPTNSKMAQWSAIALSVMGSIGGGVALICSKSTAEADAYNRKLSQIEKQKSLRRIGLDDFLDKVALQAQMNAAQSHLLNPTNPTTIVQPRLEKYNEGSTDAVNSTPPESPSLPPIRAPREPKVESQKPEIEEYILPQSTTSTMSGMSIPTKIAANRITTLIIGGTRCGKSHLAKASLGELMKAEPQSEVFISAARNENWLGWEASPSYFISNGVDIKGIRKAVDAAFRIYEERAKLPESERDTMTPVLLILDDWTGQAKSLDANGKASKLVNAQLASILNNGAAVNVRLWVTMHTGNLDCLKFMDSSTRSSVSIAAVGRTVYNAATEQEEGGYGPIATLLSNPKMFPGVDVSELKQELEDRIDERDGSGVFQVDPLALIKIGSNVWLQDLGIIHVDFSVVPTPNPQFCNLQKTPENQDEISQWDTISYPSELQYMPAHTAGLYAALIDSTVVYIGESSDLWSRWNGGYKHRIKQHLDHAVAEGFVVNVAYKIMADSTVDERRTLETNLQKQYQTPWNGTADKSIPARQHQLTPVQQAIIAFIDDNGGTAKARDVYRAASLSQFNLTAESTKKEFKKLEEMGYGEILNNIVGGAVSVSFRLS